jgi:hypothetical protein
MTEMTDDLSTPLGQKTERQKRRFRLPFTAMQALAVLLGLFLVAFLAIAFSPTTRSAASRSPVSRCARRRGRKAARSASGRPNRLRNPRRRRQAATARPSPSSTAPAASARMS